MRRSGTLVELRGADERHEPHGGAGKRVGAAFLPVDDADRVRDDQAGVAKRLDGGERGAP